MKRVFVSPPPSLNWHKADRTGWALLRLVWRGIVPAVLLSHRCTAVPLLYCCPTAVLCPPLMTTHVPPVLHSSSNRRLELYYTHRVLYCCTTHIEYCTAVLHTSSNRRLELYYTHRVTVTMELYYTHRVLYCYTTLIE